MAAKSNKKKSSAKAAASSKKSASSKGTKYVYTWGAGKADGNGGMKNLLGGKGANLAEMTRIGLPVPPGFTITTELCTYYYANKRTYPPTCRRRWRPGSPTWRR
jgi:pyruvate,orthophosphate dikinase